MSIQKTLLLFIVASIVSFIIYFGYIQYAASQNVKHSKIIQIDFTKDEMLKIMGKPDSKYFTSLDNGKEVYFYQPPYCP
jgi:hypothetical protein